MHRLIHRQNRNGMPSTAAVRTKLQDRVVKALENPEYDWRTIPGIASEIHASESDIITALNAMKDVVIRSADSEGRSIFTTRNHYEKTHGFGDKLVSALTDRVVP